MRLSVGLTRIQMQMRASGDLRGPRTRPAANDAARGSEAFYEQACGSRTDRIC